VRFWNVITSMPVPTCMGHKHHVLCTLWTPDAKLFISADRSGEIRVWDPQTGSFQIALHTPHYINKHSDCKLDLILLFRQSSRSAHEWP